MKKKRYVVKEMRFDDGNEGKEKKKRKGKEKKKE